VTLTFFKSDLKGLGTFKVETIFMTCKETTAVIGTTSRRSSFDDAVNSHLSGCPDCRRHAGEMSSLLSLLSAQPRVQAPADFDFRLRARLARAKAEQISPAGLFEKLWASTFSWGQAATAMATLALVVVFSTFYFKQDNVAPVKIDDVAVANLAASAPQSKPEAVSETKPQQPAVETVTPTPVRFTSRNVKVSSAAIKSEPPANPAPQTDIASVDNSRRFYHPESRQLVPDRNLLGAEAASANSVKPMTVALTF
jgi:hypothetical protein